MNEPIDRGRRAISGALLATAASRLVAAPARPQPGLVLPVSAGPEGWDSTQVSCPRVLRLGPGDFRMWYYGRDAAFDPGIKLPSGRLGHARSRDGIRWTRVPGPATRGALLDPAVDAARFDSGHLGLGEVQRDGDGFEMWYFGGDRSITRLGAIEIRGFPLRIGHARSVDGIAWRRTDGPFRGAVFDAGPPGSPDEATVGWPQVLKLRPDLWRMYYHTVSQALGFTVCVAESGDAGRSWRRRGVVLGRGAAGRFDADGASTRHVFRRGDRFMMLYEGWGGDRLSIGLAQSRDGLEWERVSGPAEGGAVFSPSAPGSGLWDCGAVGTPWLVEVGGASGPRFHLYYVARPEKPPGGGELDVAHQVGLAVSDDPQLLHWRRWEPA